MLSSIPPFSSSTEEDRLRDVRKELAVATVEAVGKCTASLRAEILTSQSGQRATDGPINEWLDELKRTSETCLNATFDALTTEKDRTKLAEKCRSARSMYDIELGELTHVVRQIPSGASSSGALASGSKSGISPSSAASGSNDLSNASVDAPDMKMMVDKRRDKMRKLLKLEIKWRSTSSEVQAAANRAWNESTPEASHILAEKFTEYRTAVTRLAERLPDLRAPVSACVYALIDGGVSAIIGCYLILDPRRELFLPPKGEEAGSASRPFWEREVSRHPGLTDNLKSKIEAVQNARRVAKGIFTSSGSSAASFERKNPAAHTAALTVAVTHYDRKLAELESCLDDIEHRRETFIHHCLHGQELGATAALQIPPELPSEAESARKGLHEHLDVGGPDLTSLHDIDIKQLGEYKTIRQEGSTPAQF